MMKELCLLFLLFYMTNGKATSPGPPGKPTLTHCRSPEKETFTCWWRPGSDGGLPTTYTLHYFKDSSETEYQCPDYHTAGPNSCFFNKNETSVWVNYNITVVATNDLGKTSSDPVDVDVAFIVQPHAPENVTVAVIEIKDWPSLRVSWESPHKADIRSGWITLVYELRSKIEGEEEWEEHYPGQQKTFNIFSITSGCTYLVEVRCRADHGFWSEWSTTTKTKVPEYYFRERSLWILIVVFVSCVFLILAWILYTNSHSLKHCLLPPVPGPKIKGFDHQLLKNGSYKDGLNALMLPDFPPTSSSTYEDLLVEYLEVFVPGEQHLSMEDGKDLNDRYFKSESSTSDSDSGRGSCDSHTLLIDKCKEAKEEEEQHADLKECGEILEPQIPSNSWVEEVRRYDDSPNPSNGRVKTWPSVFTPLPQYTTSPVQEKSSLEMVKQHCLSDTLFPPTSLSSDLTHLNTNEPFGPSYWKVGLNNKQPALIQPPMQACRHLQTYSNFNICKADHQVMQSPPFRASEYAEVQKVNKEDMVVLQPVESGQGHREGCPLMHQGEEYSKVKEVDSDNMLLLESGGGMGGGMDRCLCEAMEKNGVSQSCYIFSPNGAQMKHSSMPVPEQAMANTGYVDTASVLTMPMF